MRELANINPEELKKEQDRDKVLRNIPEYSDYLIKNNISPISAGIDHRQEMNNLENTYIQYCIRLINNKLGYQLTENEYKTYSTKTTISSLIAQTKSEGINGVTKIFNQEAKKITRDKPTNPNNKTRSIQDIFQKIIEGYQYAQEQVFDKDYEVCFKHIRDSIVKASQDQRKLN